jgi:hypothetical protein
MKTNELTGAALNWAVAMAEGDKVYRPRLGRPSDWDKEAYLKDGSDDRWVVRVQNPKVAHFVDWTYNPSGGWWEGGPIIEREKLFVKPTISKGWRSYQRDPFGNGICHSQYGPTPLIAAMRCYVASKLGDEVEIPKELL